MSKACFAEGTIIKGVGVLEGFVYKEHLDNVFGIESETFFYKIKDKPMYRLLLSNNWLVDCYKYSYIMSINREGVKKKMVWDLRKTDLVPTIVSLIQNPYHEISPLSDMLKDYMYKNDGVVISDDIVFEFFPKRKLSEIKKTINIYLVKTTKSPYVIANGILMRTRA